MKIAAVAFIMILLLASCGQDIYYHQEEDYTQQDVENVSVSTPAPSPPAATPTSAPTTTPISTPTPTPDPMDLRQPAILTVSINDTIVQFYAYEIAGELFISVDALRHALEDTMAWFWFSDSPNSGSLARSVVEAITTYRIDGITYATLAGLSSIADFEILSQEGSYAVITTHEPYISAEYFADIVGFLTSTYPQLFTREIVWEDFGYGSGNWYAGSLRIFDFYGGRPVLGVGFHDAGSWGPQHYMYINGRYRRVGSLPSLNELFLYYDGGLVWLSQHANAEGKPYFISIGDSVEYTPGDIDESLLVPARLLRGLYRQVRDEAIARMWPALTLREDGVMIDANLPDEVVRVVELFVRELEREHTLMMIRASLIDDDLVNVTAMPPSGFSYHHWVQVRYGDDGWVVYGHDEGWFWWGD